MRPRTTSSRYSGLPPAWRTMRSCKARSNGRRRRPHRRTRPARTRSRLSASGSSRSTLCVTRPQSSAAGSNGGRPVSTTSNGRSHSQSASVGMASIDAASAHCRSSSTSTSGPFARRRSSTVRSVIAIWRLSRSGSISLDRSTRLQAEDVADDRNHQLDLGVASADGAHAVLDLCSARTPANRPVPMP